MVSMTETVVDRRAEGSQPSSPTSVSPFTGSNIQTTSPNPPHIPHPIREETLDSRSLPPVIPPEHNHRTLVLCFDGTGDQFDADNSNIVQLVSLLKKNDRNKQMVYYQVCLCCVLKKSCCFLIYTTRLVSELIPLLNQ